MAGTPEPVVITGTSCQLAPDVDDGRKLFEFCAAARCSARPIPSRWRHETWYHPGGGEVNGCYNVEAGSYMDRDLATFDAPFFSIGETEATAMDPQLRLMLECSYTALENAGITLSDISGRSDVGVFAASAKSDYSTHIEADHMIAPKLAVMGTAATMFGNRLSYYYNIHGPSISTDTACSSSLTALNMAVESIRSGRCSIALVGCSFLQVSPCSLAAMSGLGVLSPQGKSCSFDADANGYGRGEGVGCLVLMSETQAKASNGLVRAVVRASGVNHSGRSQGITSPDGPSQIQLIRDVYASAGIDPIDTAYVEAHGTGTSRGDEIEVHSVAEAFRAKDRPANETVYIGSSKSNFGHTEASSGLVSVLKSIAMLEQAIILPNANFKSPNAALSSYGSQLTVPTSCIPWPAGAPLRISVNNFGFGGSNAHVVLEREAPLPKSSLVESSEIEDTADKLASSQLFSFSARDDHALNLQLAEYLNYLEIAPSDSQWFRNLSYTLNCRRTRFQWQTGVVASSARELQQNLRRKPILARRAPKSSLVWVFTGQGSAWPKMATTLLHIDLFADVLKQAERVFKSLGAKWSLIEELQKPDEDSRLNAASLSQPAVTAIQAGLVVLLRYWGLTPSAVIGHSSGEIAAAFAAGAVDLDTCLAIAYCRGAIVSTQEVPEYVGQGTMVAVGASPAEVEPLVASLLTGLANIACYNSPNSVTVAGDVAAISELEALLHERGLFYRRLSVDQAYHSDHMLPFAGPYYDLIGPMLKDVQPVESGVRFFSSVTGAPIRLEQLKSAWHWVSNLASPVRFSDGFETMVKEMTKASDTNLQVVEIGPHKALSGPVKSMLGSAGKGAKTMYTPTLVRGADGAKCMLNMVAGLLGAGASLDLKAVFECGDKSSDGQLPQILSDLPHYQFNHTRRYWHESRLAPNPNKISSIYNIACGNRVDQTPEPALQCRNRFSLNDIPWLRDHVINGTTLFPLAGYICTVIESLDLLRVERAVEIRGYQLDDIAISKAMTLAENEKVELWTTLSANGSSDPGAALSFQVSSWTAARGYVLHCSGLASLVLDKSGDTISEVSATSPACILARLRQSAPYELDCDQFYRSLNRGGLHYGHYFRRVTSLHSGVDSAFGILTACDTTSCMPAHYEGSLKMHPTMLDAALHVGTIHIGSKNGDPSSTRAHVPVHVDRVFLSSTAQHHNDLSLEVHSFGAHTPPKSRSSTANMIIVPIGSDIPILEMDQLESLDVHESEEHVKQSALINPHKIAWLDHPDDVEVAEFSKPLEQSDVEELKALEKESVTYLSKALMTKPINDIEPHLDQFYSWISRTLAETQAGAVMERPDSAYSAGDRAEMMAQRGNTIAGVLHDGQESSQLPQKDDLLSRLKDETLVFKAARECMIGLVARFAYLQPSMRILEVGASAGATTTSLLQAMTSGSDSPRFEHYDFTDGSSDSLPKAQESFVSWQSRMDFKKLDITQDVIGQGFGMGSYDLIVGARAMQTSPDVAKSLKNVRQLLKPGGVLVLTEMTKSTPLSFPLAMSPDWWAQGENGPCFTKSEWSGLLDTTGFTGMCGFWEDDRGNCVFWTRRRARDDLLTNGVKVEPLAIVASETSTEGANEILKMLTSISSEHHWDLSVLKPSEAVDFPGVLVCLEDPNSFSLASTEPETFETIKSMLLSSKRVVWVTSPDYEAEESCLKAFALGFGRVIRGENASRQFVVLQADTENRDVTALSNCITRLLEHTYFAGPGAGAYELEFRQCGDRLQFGRLLPDEEVCEGLEVLAETVVTKTVNLIECQNKISATCDQPGTLSSLHFTEDDSADKDTPLGEYEVLIQVEAMGVNFKDLLITLARVPWEQPGKECAGTIVAVGEGASRTYAVGDRVVHLGDGLFTNRVRCNIYSIARISGSMTMQEAATIPIVFATAYECLVNVARLEEGESVLIHAASGGVGQAAILIAQQIGTEIYCTVSSPEKKELVMSRYGIPSNRIFSSRSVDFAKNLMAATKRKGVDVVVNSVANEMLRATWNSIATHGRFVEIGKRDALVNNSLDMAPFARGASYSAVDLNITIGNKPKAARKLLQTVMDLFQDKHFRPAHPITTYPFGKVHSALRTMQTGQHTGKLVLTLGRDEDVEVRSPRPGLMCLSKDASYIIVGGTGGLGRAMVDWMVERGARHIHLLSRSGNKAIKTASWASTLMIAREIGATVDAHPCNVSDLEDVQRTLAEIVAAGEPPVKGVIHGAMVLRDALYESTNAEDWAAVTKPKIQGGLNLHKATQNDRLDFFICLSSVSALGLALGQSSYAASNSVLDALCAWRAQKGLPAVSIGLPAIADAGYVAENAPLPGSSAFEGANMAFREVKLLIEAALDVALFSPEKNNNHTVAGLLKHPALLTACQDKGPLFSVLLRDIANACGDTGTANANGSALSVKALLAEAESLNDAKNMVANAMGAKIAAMMSISPEDITTETSLGDLGIDSLVAVEIRNWMSKELEATIPVLEIIGTASVAALAELTIAKSPLTTRFVGDKEGK